MAIKSVKKIYLLGHAAIEPEVIAGLQEVGVVEVRPFPEWLVPGAVIGGQASAAGNDELNKIDFLLDFLKKHAPPGREAHGGKIALSDGEFRRVVLEEKPDNLHERCKRLEKDLSEIRAKREALAETRQHLLPWLPYEGPLVGLGPMETIWVAAGQIPQGYWADFKDRCLALGEAVALLEVNADGKSRYVIVLAGREYGEKLSDILREVEFTPVQFDLTAETPRQAADRLEGEIAAAAADEKRTVTAIHTLIPAIRRLKVLHDHYANVLAREKLRDSLARTDAAFCLAGWLAASDAAAVKEYLGKRFPALEAITADPEPGDTVPVILENKPLAEPFEVVTDLYGRPAYTGIDPTPLLSSFFAVFFGFCLTDAGYGIVLMILTAWLLYKAGPFTSPMRKKFYRLFFLGGAATVALGAMVGGWFGVTVSWKLFDPLEDLFVFFGLAIGLGILHLIFGLAIKMTRNFKAGDWESGLYDQGLWILVLLALTGLGLAKAKVLPSGLASHAALLATLGAVGIVFFQGRGADKNSAVSGNDGRWQLFLWWGLTIAVSLVLLGRGKPMSGYMALALAGAIVLPGYRRLGGLLARVGMGLYSLYGISGFLGDTLSYSRLVALGLTTGIVGMIINKMAGIARSLPILGWLMALGILVIGHAFNLVINLLGAFVHSCRLQYVEFFTKFYEGGGKPLRPFKFERTYTLPVAAEEV